MKKLNYQVYALKAGKAGTKDDNNLYLDGEFEGTKIKSVTSIATENETLLEKPDVDEDLIEYLETHKNIGVENNSLVEYQNLSFLAVYNHYLMQSSLQIVWSGAGTVPSGEVVVDVCIKMNIGDKCTFTDTTVGPPAKTIVFKKDFKQILDISKNSLTISSEYYDVED